MYLLAAPAPRPHAEIRRNVELYHGLSDQAFLRAFERDKHLLRELEVPLRTVEMPGTEAGVGYVIDAAAFELPPIAFDRDEAMVVELAARMWRDKSRSGTGLAADAVGGLLKVRSSVDHDWTDAGTTDAFVPRLAAREPGFDLIWDALLAGRAVRFTYRGVARTVHPWRLVSRFGSSYLVGFDETRDAPRVFKLARITEGPVAVGKVGASVPPDPAEVDAAVTRLLDPDPPRRDAVVAVRRGRQGVLTRSGTPVAAGDAGEVPAGFDAWRVRFGSTDRFAQDLAAAGADVVVLGPTEVRDAVVAHLRGVLA